MVYRIPARRGTKKASEKRITASAFEQAFDVLQATGQITRRWFAQHLPDLERDGTCNFTTVGGVFELLGEVRYVEPGVYERIIPANKRTQPTHEHRPGHGESLSTRG